VSDTSTQQVKLLPCQDTCIQQKCVNELNSVAFGMQHSRIALSSLLRRVCGTNTLHVVDGRFGPAVGVPA
jgi:hypothetical protein